MQPCASSLQPRASATPRRCNPAPPATLRPLRAQVKRMMRLANLTPTTAIAKDAVFLVSKSAETFLQV